MCGIVGFVTAEHGTAKYKGGPDRRNFMAQGLVVDTLRGEDSTGIMYALETKPGNKAGFLKQVGDGYSFVNTDAYGKVANDMSKYRFMIGHNRAATVGNVTVDTAHPFTEGAVTGLHNGTVRSGMHGLPVPMAKFEGEVDSHCIIHNLSVVQPDEAYDKVISKIDGAYMLVWFDGRDGSLNLARNSERTFHIAHSLDDDTLYFASEALQLEWLLDRNHIQHCGIMSLNPGIGLKFTDTHDVKPELIEFDIAPKYVAPRYTGNYGGWSNYDRAWDYPSAGKYQPPADNKILLGGQRRAVPQIMQEELMELGLAVEDRIHVKPMAAQPPNFRQGGDKGYCVAYSDTCATTFLVQEVPSTTLASRMDFVWTVRPVGVWKQDDGELVLARLVASAPTTESLTLSSTSTDDPIPMEEFGFAGPGGTSLTKWEWLELTEGGCAECETALILADAPTLVWEGEAPICVSCQVINPPTEAAVFDYNDIDTWL